MPRLHRSALVLILPAALAAVVLAAAAQPETKPQPEKPDAETFSAATKKVGPALFIIGRAKGGHGTGFLISKEHRLIATNAHVADIMDPSGKLFAVRNGTATVYKVDKVYYHPGVKRFKNGEGKPSIISMDPADGDVDPLCPDVAVLKLAADGPELPAAIPLADTKTLDDLLARPIGILGFPGHDSKWPIAGELATASYHDGSVSRLTGFDLQPAEGPAGRKMVQYTIQNFGGYSGSPIYLADGRVVAVNNMVRAAKIKELDITKSIAHGIRADAVLEVLAHHKLPELKAVATIDPGVPVPVAPLAKAKALERLRHLLYLGAVNKGYGDGDITELGTYNPTMADEVCDLAEAIETVRRVRIIGASDRHIARLARLERVTSLFLTNGRVTDTGLAQMRNRNNLAVLDLSGNSLISSAGLAHLCESKGLDSLDLSRTRIGDEGLVELKKFPKLRWLKLNGTKITDAGMKEMANYPEIVQVEINDTAITDVGLAAWKGNPILSFFSAERTAITDVGLHQFTMNKGGFLSLTLNGTRVTGTYFQGLKFNVKSDISLNDCPLSDEGLAAAIPFLAGSEVVSTLSHSLMVLGDGAKVSPDGIAKLRDMKKLTDLTIRFPGLTPAHIRALAGLPKLQSLTLEGTEVTEEVMKEVAALPKLTFLSLIDSNVTNAGLAHLSKSLQWVYINKKSRVTDEGMKHLARLPELISLRLHGFPLTAVGLRHLSVLPKLADLTLSGPTIGDEEIAALSGFPQLDRLGLNETSFKDKGAASFCKIPKLENLGLVKCEITGVGLSELAKCPRLVRLSFVQCEKITSAGFQPFRGSILESLDVRLCPGIDDKILDVFAGELGGLNLRNLDAQQTKVTREGVLKLKVPDGWDPKKDRPCSIGW